MHIKKKNGMTAMVDAMIFIVVIGIAVSAMCAHYGNGDPASNEASDISEKIFSAKFRFCDIVDTEETRLIGMPDAVAFHLLTGDSSVIDYLEDVFRSLTQRSDSFFFAAEYDGESFSFGNKTDNAVSSSIREYTVTYGGTVSIEIILY